MNKQNFGRKISQINVIRVLVTFLCASMCAAPFQYHSRHPALSDAGDGFAVKINPYTFGCFRISS